MTNVIIEDKPLHSALIQFIFPFSIQSDRMPAAKEYMNENGFSFFELLNKEQETAYYGGKNRVSHKDLEHYFLPFTSDVLFPKEADDPFSFQRYSKALDIEAEMHSSQIKVPFTIQSLDLFFLPFDLGFLTIRTELNNVSYSEAIEFAARFRVLENRSRDDREAVIEYRSKEYCQVENFLFKELLPGFTPFLDVDAVQGAYFESLPFFIDERMFVQALYQFQEDATITEADQYRGIQLDGVDEKGNSTISANNNEFIHEYCRNNSFLRLAPNTYHLIDEHVFCCLTNDTGKEADNRIDQMYGEYYYGLLLNLFHKVVLLRLSNAYSHVHLERGTEKTEKLIGEITLFSARYFFLELATQSQGREIFIMLKKAFKNQDLYDDVKQTLSNLYQYQGQKSAKRNNYLITILTIYTVITGIYGMNLVIDQLKKPLTMATLEKFGFFEYLALFVTITGIAASILLGIAFLSKWMREKRNHNAIEQ